MPSVCTCNGTFDPNAFTRAIQALSFAAINPARNSTTGSKPKRRFCELKRQRSTKSDVQRHQRPARESSRYAQQLRKAELVPIRINNVKEALTPRGILRRIGYQSLRL